MADADDSTLSLELDHQEALVLLEWLGRRDDVDADDDPTPFELAVQRVLWDVDCQLESSHPAVFASDYDARLQRAIEAVRDEEIGED